MLSDAARRSSRRRALCGLVRRPPPGHQELLVEADAEKFFVPPYVGHRGWLGVRLNDGVDWEELTGIVEDAYCTVAPQKLIAELEQRP
jgi:hypothetical protein